MSEHYIVLADHAHLRIYRERQEPGQRTPALDRVAAVDFPAGKESYSDQDSDMAGRFPSGGRSGPGQGGAPSPGGMSIDERLPMQREAARRRAQDVAAQLEAFLRKNPSASWDFAAGPEFHPAVLERVSPPVRQRLRRSVAKDLVNQRLDEVRGHFAE